MSENKLSLGKKLILSFTGVGTVTLLLGGLAFWGTSSLNNSINEISSVRLPSVQTVLDLKSEARHIRGTMRTLGIPGLDLQMRERQYKNLATSKDVYETAWKRYEPLPKTREEAEVWKNFIPAWEIWLKDNTKLADTFKQLDNLGLAHPMEVKMQIEKFSKDHYFLAYNILQLLTAGDKFSGGEDHTLCNLGKWLGTFTSNSPKISNLIKQIEVPHHNFHQTVKRIKQLVEQGKVTEGQNIFNKELKSTISQTLGILHEITEVSEEATLLEHLAQEQLLSSNTDTQRSAAALLEKLAEINTKESDRVSTSANSTATFIKLLMIFAALISFALSLILGVIIGRGISTPMLKISEQIGEASNQVASASEQLSEASQQLSEAANEQASSIEETSASLEELTGMVNNNVENAENARKVSNQVKDIAETGNQSMQLLIKSMDEILKSNEKIQQLVKVIGEIGDKTAVIDEIVFQTKLLSFNASVEAERAGEHGRGFAVVAQEVGNLAQMSGKAAQEISSIVKESIKNAEAITTENKTKVENSNKQVSEVAKILAEISKSSNMVFENAKQVLDASKEQAGGIGQINTAMSQLDRATQENASTAEEAASSSEELSAQAEVLNGLTGELKFMVTGEASPITTEHTKDRKAGRIHKLSQGIKQIAQLRPKGNAKTKIVASHHPPVTESTEEAWDKL